MSKMVKKFENLKKYQQFSENHFFHKEKINLKKKTLQKKKEKNAILLVFQY